MSPHVRHRLTLELECPRCKSAPGKRCTSGMFHGERIELYTPCEERIAAAREPGLPAIVAEDVRLTMEQVAAWLRRKSVDASKARWSPDTDMHDVASDVAEMFSDAAQEIEDGSWKE